MLYVYMETAEAERQWNWVLHGHRNLHLRRPQRPSVLLPRRRNQKSVYANLRARRLRLDDAELNDSLHGLNFRKCTVSYDGAASNWLSDTPNQSPSIPGTPSTERSSPTSRPPPPALSASSHTPGTTSATAATTTPTTSRTPSPLPSFTRSGT